MVVGDLLVVRAEARVAGEHLRECDRGVHCSDRLKAGVAADVPEASR
jgi:hypothetical protein